VINLARYYGFVAVTMKYRNYTIILMMPRVTRHFNIQVGTMSIGKHKDMV